MPKTTNNCSYGKEIIHYLQYSRNFLIYPLDCNFKKKLEEILKRKNRAFPQK